MNFLPEFWLPWLALVALEVGVVVLVAEVGSRWTRSARVRRWLWQAGFAGLVLLLALELLGWRIQASRTPAPVDRVAMVRVGPAVAGPELSPIPPAPIQGRGPLVPLEALSESRPGNWIAGVWAAGALALLGRLVVARWFLLRGRRCRAVPAESTRARLQELARRAGLTEVRLVRWTGLRGPVAFGVLRPTVAIPEDFEVRFEETQRDAMLAHELGHLAGRDPFWFLLADLIGSLAWWHPALWWARRRLRAVSEQVADDACQSVAGGPVALAEALVSVGRDLVVSGGLGVGGSGMESELAGRVLRLLHPSEPQVSSRGWRCRSVQVSGPVLATLLALLPLGVTGSPTKREVAPQIASADPVESVLPAPSIPAATDAPVLIPVREAAVTEEKPKPVVATVLGGEGDPARSPGATRPVEVPPGTSPAAVLPPAASQTPSPAVIATPAAPPAPATAPPPPVIRLAVKWVELREGGGQTGWLDWVFGHGGTNQAKQEASVSPAAGPSFPEGVRVDRIATDNEWRALDAAQSVALMTRFEQQAEADILSAPIVTTRSGRQAQLSISDVRTLVLGPKKIAATATNAAGVSYDTVPVSVGTSVDLTPWLDGDGRGFEIFITAAYTEFLGYDDPKESAAKRTKPRKGEVKAVPALPHLRVRSAIASARCPIGQTILLRGPVADSVVKFKDRVPVLGSIPIAGRLFRHEGTQTNRTRVYLLIQPTLEQ